LNLLQNDQQIVEYRISGEYPIYQPDSQPFTLKVVQQAHILTLHGDVGLTMAKVREGFWVPWLRQLVKRIRRKCNGCKRFQVKPYQVTRPGKLLKTRRLRRADKISTRKKDGRERLLSHVRAQSDQSDSSGTGNVIGDRGVYSLLKEIHR
jgi:hypothetical protein